MKRRVLLAAAGILATLPRARAQTAAPTRITVVASFSILGDFVREIAGDAVDLKTLVGPDQDAHVFEPSPADARTLAGAKVVVVNGLGFEGWLERLVKASGFAGVRVVASEGIKTLRAASRGDPGHGGGHGHSHRAAGSDPHVWQDPRRAQAMVRNIARGLAAADPARAAIYEANARAYAERLAALEAAIAQDLAAVPPERRRIVTSHDAFAYFEDRFKIDFRAPRGVSTETEPSAADIARLIREIRREKVKVVFLENISDPRMIEQVAREGGAQMGGRLYSDALSGAAGPAATYMTMMRYNASRLRDAMLAE
ncbi:MAG: zinc ABC transporter substrate-binding protein [Alphaproteobacteria bacterium]|nr:zinc ABC transporter substrate-binding protein [Alphaproteobacteria bacterium]